MEEINHFFVSQVLAGLAFITGMAAFQFSSRAYILRMFCVSAFVYSTHFMVLGEPQAALFVFISSVRFLIASVSTHRHWLWLFLLVIALNLLMTYESPINFLSFAATSLGTYGSFNASIVVLRVCMGLATAIWVLHNFLVWSPVAIMMEVLFLISNAVGWWRGRSQFKS